MYAIREDTARKLLRIDLSGRLPTDEALRALSQAFTLIEASGIRGVRCDLTGVKRGPGGLLMLAGSLAVRQRDETRIAFIGDEGQMPFVTRLIRFSGIHENVRAFDSATEADAWLSPVLARTNTRLSATDRRHAAALIGASPAASTAGEATATRTRTTRTRPAA